MVSGSGKKRSPLFSVLDWIRSLCSGCFGIVKSRWQRPLPVPSSPLSILSSHAKLDLTMGTAAQEDGNTAHPHSLAWKFANEPHVGLGNGDDAAFDDESDNNDGMFHGLFYLGSKVLTEVEMQSPVEESKIITTPIRTPRRSNNSSRASSTRELNFGSSQICLVDSESSSSSAAIAVVSPCQYPTQNVSPSCVKTCSKNANSSRMCLSSSHDGIDHSLTVSSFEDNSGKQDCKSVALYKHKGRHFKAEDRTAGLPLCRESNRNLDGENLQPSLEFSQEGEQFSQSGILWNSRKCQARVGNSSPECRTVTPSLEQLKNVCAFRYRAAGKHSVVSDGLQAEIPVGSLPDGSKTNIASRGWRKDNDGGRRARSLTDEDFNELRGCIDLGFVFTQERIPDLCETLPALEVCYAIAHGPVSPVCNMEDFKFVSPGSPPISPWKVASPGDQPQQVKTRLRHWAQAVACNLRQAH